MGGEQLARRGDDPVAVVAGVGSPRARRFVTRFNAGVLAWRSSPRWGGATAPSAKGTRWRTGTTPAG
ncbi:hypothetical protein [Isoptericola sp. NPDC019482]|uniref:hypothetical protein n=1 Tax=Isoptericola sp. NPDC019482 TaxID=3154688 RepID=UPI00348F0A36